MLFSCNPAGNQSRRALYIVLCTLSLCTLLHFRALCVIGLAVALDEEDAVAEEFMG